MEVRPATESDIPDVLVMIAALAAHHGDACLATLETVQRDLFGAERSGNCLIACGPEAVGYAVLVPRLSLQNGRRGADMHHLYVAPNTRGMGVGRALIEACKSQVSAQGGTFLLVGTHPDNHAAQAFYERSGFERRAGGGPQYRIALSGRD